MQIGPQNHFLFQKNFDLYSKYLTLLSNLCNLLNFYRIVAFRCLLFLIALIGSIALITMVSLYLLIGRFCVPFEHFLFGNTFFFHLEKSLFVIT